MSGPEFLGLAVTLSLGALTLALLLTIFRIWVGRDLPNRVLGLDTMTTVGIGFIAVAAIKTGYSLYLDIAIALGLVGFLATVAFSRYVLTRGIKEARSVAGKIRP